MQRRYRIRPSAVLAIGLFAIALAAPMAGWSTETRRVATGLARPVALTAPPGDTNRVFVVEQHTGQILILNRGSWTLNGTPFLTVPVITTEGERGLLGLAFDPDYASNGFFYVYIADPDSLVLRYQVSADPDIADPASELPIIDFAQPEANHNGGWLGFGSDDYLYISTGDGGGSDDGHGVIGNAQNTENLLGKILRIDVLGDDFPADPNRNYAIPANNPFVGVLGDDEIWVYGLRNPWRSSFDRLTGDLYIGDVGQDFCEEISFQHAASAGGENYGWRLREGVIATPTGGVGGNQPVDGVDPIMDYPHAMTAGTEPCSSPGPGFTGNSVTGGYVYRGPIATYQGRYFFADFFGTSLWSFIFDGSPAASFDGTNYMDLTDHAGEAGFTPDQGTFDLISSFGEDADGNLYVMNLIGGEVFFIPEPNAMSQQVAALVALLAIGRRRFRRRRAGAVQPVVSRREPCPSARGPSVSP